jgi:hypothetical protein
MRRRKASSPRSVGLRFVENTRKVSNGAVIFPPVRKLR